MICLLVSNLSLKVILINCMILFNRRGRACRLVLVYMSSTLASCTPSETLAIILLSFFFSFLEKNVFEVFNNLHVMLVGLCNLVINDWVLFVGMIKEYYLVLGSEICLTVV